MCMAHFMCHQTIFVRFMDTTAHFCNQKLPKQEDTLKLNQYYLKEERDLLRPLALHSHL